jgi:hypothetical protein
MFKEFAAMSYGPRASYRFQTIFSIAVYAIYVGTSGTLFADSNSTGANGVNAAVTGLTGAGQTVGILEASGRPAVAGDAGNNVLVAPTGLFTATPTNSWVNFDVDQHAESVASTIISTGPVSGGIAQGATLYAADNFSNTTNADIYRQGIVASQKLYQLANIRAVNMSLGYALPGGAGGFNKYGTAGTVFDGTSELTEYVDWASQNYNAVSVIAGNETGGAQGLDIPTDAYNGLIVGATTTNDGTTSGVFDRMASFNDVNQLPNVPGDPTQLRRTIDIVAPGDNVQDAALTTNAPPNNVLVTDAGTSFAAPHVAGAVALMAQDSVARGMGGDSRKEMVQRAILMNSADKIQGVLGMDHTILRQRVDDDNTGVGLNWVQERQAEVTAGVNRNAVPLDNQLGVGQLNVRRAKIQLEAGEQKPGPVQYIGWDYNTVASATLGGSTSQTYALPAMVGGQWISATLTWDRQINLNDSLVANGKFDAETYIALNAGGTAPLTPGKFAYAAGDALTDVNGNGTFDNITETLAPPAGKSGLNDLDLFVLPHGDTNLADAIATSNSSIYNLEHIFFQLPATILNPTSFDIEVLARDLTQTSTLSQDYGLAWWTAVPEPGTIALMAFGGVALLFYRRRRTV